MSGGWRLRRRVWTEAGCAATAEGWAVTLDGRTARTPAGAALVAPVRALAEASAAEFAAQGEDVRPETMPLTRALATAIDCVAPARAAVAAEIAGYGASDLLCYRAATPAALAAAQAAAWDPWLAWARTRHGAALVCTVGVTPVAQPAESLARLAAEVARRDALALTALADLVALSGSLVLGLAVAEGALAPEAGWAASRVDESWQIARWGEDAEAAAAAAARRDAFLSAARLAALLRDG